MSQPEHPGTIVYVDGNTGEVLSTESADQVPESMRFVDTEAGPIPVLKVVAFTSDEQRIIREYGPDDQELRSTLQLREI